MKCTPPAKCCSRRLFQEVAGMANHDAGRALWAYGLALISGMACLVVLELSRSANGETLQQYGAGPSKGMWGEHTAPIDWCETNYAITRYVAEWWNTTSCVAYVVAALLAVRIPCRSTASGLLALYAWLLAMTGIFSALFHGTLWWWGQKLDEVAETATLVALLHMPHSDALRRTVLHATLAAAGIIIVPVAFCEVHLVATILCLLRILHREIGRLKSANMLWWRGQRAALSGLVGFGCWLVDKAACSSLPTVNQTLQLHAWWHVMTAMALYHAVGAMVVVMDSSSVPPTRTTTTDRLR